MPVYCCVRDCKNNSIYNKNVRFYEFPKIWTRSAKLRKLSEIRFNKWFAAINKKNLKVKSSRVCSAHFHSGKCATLQDRTNPDWVPSLHLGKPSKTSTDQVTLSSGSEIDCDDDVMVVDTTFNQEENEDTPEQEPQSTSEHSKLPRSAALICCVPNCKNVRSKFENNVTFFRFPNVHDDNDESPSKRLSAWINAIKRIDITHLNAKYKIICSEHFHKGAPADDKSDPDWIPNRNLPNNFTKAVKRTFSESTKNPHRKKSEDSFDPLAEEEIKILPSVEIDKMKKGYEEFKLENELLKKKLAEKEAIIASQQAEINKLKETHNTETKEKDSTIQILEMTNLQISLSRDSFKNDDRKVNYFTGLSSYAVLDIIYNFVERNLVACLMKGINKFDALILVLMKLRLDLPLTYIGYRYGIAGNTAAIIFHTNLKMLSTKIGSFIRWPKKAALRENTSVYFRRVLGNKFTALIDFIEDPGPSVSDSQLKKYIKYKYLVAISPAGAIIFVSKGYPSSLSVKEIAESCGLLDNTEDGDVIISNHGRDSHLVYSFNGSKVLLDSSGDKNDLLDDLLQDSIESMTAKTQPEANNCRIYLQKSISNLMNKYFILSNKYKVSLLKSYKSNESERYFDHIVKVCCALTNVSPALLTLESKKVS